MTGRVLRLGLFVAVTVALTVWIGATIVGVEVGDRYQLSARFDDVAGLHDGDTVKLAGVPVGKVTGIDVDRGTTVVRFSVRSDVVLPTDTTVAVRWRNLIGQRYLWLEPGEARTLLEDGDVVDRAKDVVDLGQLVNQLSPLAQAVSPDQVNRILVTLIEAFEGNEANFDGLLRDLDGVLAALADREDTIAQLLEDYDAITGAVAAREVQIDQMVQNLVAIATTFAGNDALLAQALDDFGPFSTDLDRLLTASAGDLGAVLDHLGILTSTAAGHIDQLETAFANLPSLFEQTFPVVNRGEFLRVTVLCLTVTTGQCPYPTSLSGPPNGPPLILSGLEG